MRKGKIIITLDEYRRQKGVSKYKIIRSCGVSATQLNSYCNNKITRVDLPVLARICDYLECDITDVLRYEPGERKRSRDEKDERE